MGDANFRTGTKGLIAIDKVGNQVLFLDPETYATTLALEGFAPRVHELTISPDATVAFAPIYGDGIHGKNPHPGHLLARFDLEKRYHIGDFSTYPYLAPHGLRWGPEGQLYCVCENSGVVLEMDAQTGMIEHVMQVGSNKAHRIEVTPDGRKLYTENEEDAFASVIDLKTRKRIKKIKRPHALVGLAISPDGKTVVLVDAKEPQLLLVDTDTDEIMRTVKLEGHAKPSQIARYSPTGNYLVVTSVDGAVGTVFDRTLEKQRLLQLGAGPMDMAFHADGRTVIIGNQNDSTLAVCDLEDGEVLRTVPAGVGVETLAFF